MRTTIVLIDLDNLVVSLRENRARQLDMAEVIAKAGGWKDIAEVRAYADFSETPEGLCRHLVRHSVTPVHVPTRTNGGGRTKNIADLVLSLDLQEIAFGRRDIRRIVLGAGDGDFVPAIARARRFGIEVGLIAVQGSVSHELAGFVDGTVTYLEGGRPLRNQVAKAA